MRRWQVAIATENPKVLYLVIELMKKLDLKFEVCPPGDSLCEDAKVVVTTLEDFNNHESIVTVDEDLDPDFTSVEILSKLNDVHNPSFAVIGIDPGMRFPSCLLRPDYRSSRRTAGFAIQRELKSFFRGPLTRVGRSGAACLTRRGGTARTRREATGAQWG